MLTVIDLLVILPIPKEDEGMWYDLKPGNNCFNRYDESAIDKLHHYFHGMWWKDMTTDKVVSKISPCSKQGLYCFLFTDYTTLYLTPGQLRYAYSICKPCRSINGFFPNEHGVFTSHLRFDSRYNCFDEDAANPDIKSEKLPVKKTNYVATLADVEWMQLMNGRWISTWSANCDTGGSMSPLSAGWEDFATEKEAISNALNRIYNWLPKEPENAKTKVEIKMYGNWFAELKKKYHL